MMHEPGWGTVSRWEKLFRSQILPNTPGHSQTVGFAGCTAGATGTNLAPGRSATRSCRELGDAIF